MCTYIKAFESCRLTADRQTDTTKISLSRRFAGGQQFDLHVPRCPTGVPHRYYDTTQHAHSGVSFLALSDESVVLSVEDTSRL